MESSAQTVAEPRFRRRVPCSLRLAGQEHRALILNLSQGGLFVRTTARARPGDTVEVDLSIDNAPAPVALEANVVWRRVSNTTVSHMSEGGIGLRLGSTPEAYARFIDELGGVPATSELGGVPATSELGETPTSNELGGTPTTSELGGTPAGDAAEQNAPAVEAQPAPDVAAQEPEQEAALELAPFEVLLKLRGAPRSRSVRVEAADDAEASSRAIDQAGEGWEVLEVRTKTRR